MQKCQIKRFKVKFHILHILTIIVKTQRLFIVLKKILRIIEEVLTMENCLKMISSTYCCVDNRFITVTNVAVISDHY